MAKRRSYGDVSETGDVGTIDMFGLDEFGTPIGLPAFYGAAGGAAVQTLSAMAIKKFAPAQAAWSEAIGGAIGIAAGAVAYYAAPRARGAAAAMMAVSAVNGVLRQFVPELLGLSGMDVEQVRGHEAAWGGVQAEQVDGVLPEVLSSSALADEAAKVRMLEGPEISGLGQNYGATIFGARSN